MSELRGLNISSLSYRELLDSIQAGTLEPEVAFLNASLVLSCILDFLPSISVFSLLS